MDTSLNLDLRKEVTGALLQYTENIKLLKVDYIGYREFHSDGSSMAFCSNEQWYKVTLDEDMIADMSMHYAQELMLLKRNDFNYIIRTASSANSRFLRELLLRDMCNSLLIYKKEKEIIRMYSFIANVANTAALNYFFNKRQLFESIIDLYKDDLANIFQKQEYQKLRLPLFSQKVVKTIFSKEEANFTRNICSIFTTRESEYIPLLVNGATNKDLASKFKISTRTAQYHVANIKKKLKVGSRFNIHESVQVQING